MNECPAVFSGPKNKKKFLEPLTIKFNVPFTDLVPDQEMFLSVSSQSNDVIRWSIQIVIYALKIDEKRDKMRLYIFVLVAILSVIVMKKKKKKHVTNFPLNWNLD